jgi:3-deoxy-D-manno-octulosonic-acid transferase
MMFIYNLFLYPLFLIALPFLMIGVLFDKKWRTGLAERFGAISPFDAARLAGKKIIWFHAASVGEVQALAPVVREMKMLKKGHDIVVTTTSVNGRNKIKKELQADILFSCLLPLDLPVFMDGFINRVYPEIAVLVETELWPNLISSLAKRRVPLVLINGRLSVKSFRLYRPLRFFFGPLLRKFDLLIMQSEKMVKRLHQLGVRDRKTIILGNTKFSSGEEQEKEREKQVRVADKRGRRIIIAGSIREGEEGMIVDAFDMIKDLNCVLIIAPRRLNRTALIEKMLVAKNLKYILWSGLRDRNTIPDYDAVVVNTMGDLSYIYGTGDVAIVGGGFLKYGGHNPMEPAAAALPIIMGRHMYNFEDTADRFVKAGGALQVDSNPEAIAAALREMLENSGSAGYKGEKNRSIIEKFRGSASTTAVLINEIMIEKNRPGGADNV